MFKYKNLIYIVLCFALVIMISCTNDSRTQETPPSAIPSDSASVSASVSTLSPSPTSAPSASTEETSSPEITTSTPSPTAIPSPTATPSPTPTITPTSTPTPEQYNGNTNFTETKTVVFSHPSGFYKKAFTLTLTNNSSNSSYKIHYTLDGNTPTAQSTVYKNGISISDLSSSNASQDKVTVVRAAVFNGNAQFRETVTATYIVNERYSDFDARYKNIAVVSITTDRLNLYGSTGIFTNYTEHGRESERPAHVEFFDSDGTAGFSIDAGLRVYGGTSRANPQKSLKLVARKEYDAENGKFKYPIFPNAVNINGDVIDRYDSFILRAGGNDNLFGGARNTLLRDALVHTLAGQMPNIVYQGYRPVVVYINGTYSGLFNLRDDTDNDYIEQHYNIPKEKVAIIAYGHENGEWFYKIDEGTEEDLNSYKNMLSWISSNNMGLTDNYTKACEMLDMDNFRKYIAVNVFANNRDWPHNNVRAWMHNGQWRFMLKDIDYSWGIYYTPGEVTNVVAEETAHSENVLRGGAGEISAMFASLMKNAEFKAEFLKLTDEIVNNYFSTSTIAAKINGMVTIMSKEYPILQTNIWYTDPTNPAAGQYMIRNSLNEWLFATETLTEYAEKRPAVFRELVYRIYG